LHPGVRSHSFSRSHFLPVGHLPCVCGFSSRLFSRCLSMFFYSKHHSSEHSFPSAGMNYLANTGVGRSLGAAYDRVHLLHFQPRSPSLSLSCVSLSVFVAIALRVILHQLSIDVPDHSHDPTIYSLSRPITGQECGLSGRPGCPAVSEQPGCASTFSRLVIRKLSYSLLVWRCRYVRRCRLSLAVSPSSLADTVSRSRLQ
jgi:hypothetical protein